MSNFLSKNAMSVDNSLKQYMSEIRNYSVLTKEEEIDLFKRLESGDLSARDELIKHNLRLVVSVAGRIVIKKEDMLDIIEEGNLGLMKAIDKFDYRKGCKFSTYAYYWIRQNIENTMPDRLSSMKIPFYFYTLNESIKRYKSDYYKENGKMPSKEETCSLFELTEEKYNNFLNYSYNFVSLSSPVNNDLDSYSKANSELGDFIPDLDNLFFEEKIFGEYLVKDIRKVFDILNENEKKVILLRYGFYGEPKTLAEIGKILGFTHERIRQIEVKAIRKIRGSKISKTLVGYTADEDYSLSNLKFFNNLYNSKRSTRGSKLESLEEKTTTDVELINYRDILSELPMSSYTFLDDNMSDVEKCVILLRFGFLDNKCYSSRELTKLLNIKEIDIENITKKFILSHNEELVSLLKDLKLNNNYNDSDSYDKSIKKRA